MAKAKRKPAPRSQTTTAGEAVLAERLRAMGADRVPVLERALFGSLAEALSNPLLPMLDEHEQGLRLFAAFELALHAATTEGVVATDPVPDDGAVESYRGALVASLHRFGALRSGPQRLVGRLAGVGASQLRKASDNPADRVMRIWAWFLLAASAGPETNAEPDEAVMAAIMAAARGWAEQMTAAMRREQEHRAPEDPEEPAGPTGPGTPKPEPSGLS